MRALALEDEARARPSNKTAKAVTPAQRGGPVFASQGGPLRTQRRENFGKFRYGNPPPRRTGLQARFRKGPVLRQTGRETRSTFNARRRELLTNG